MEGRCIYAEPALEGILSMRMMPGHYRHASLERLQDARQLVENERFAGATYFAGLSVECMLRSLLVPGLFDAKHDLLKLARGGFFAGLGDEAARKAGGLLTEVMARWLNSQRYCSEERLIAWIKREKKLPLATKGNLVKEHCRRLLDAAAELVSIGDLRWREISKRK